MESETNAVFGGESFYFLIKIPAMTCYELLKKVGQLNFSMNYHFSETHSRESEHVT